jgi:ketosteroid isomerase-like protein
MTIRRGVPVVFAALVAVTHGASAQDVASLLEQRQRAFFDAVTSRDADATAGAFSESGILQIAGMPQVEGRDAIRRFYERLYSFLSGSSATPEATQVSDSGDLAYSRGRTTNAFTDPQGLREYTGKFLVVWERQGETWSIAVYSVSSDQQDAGR